MAGSIFDLSLGEGVKKEGDLLSASEAIALLGSRISDWYGGEKLAEGVDKTAGQDWRPLLTYIVAGMGDMRTKSVLEAIDVRALLRQVMAAPGSKPADLGAASLTGEDGNSVELQLTRRQRELAATYYVDITEQMRGQLISELSADVGSGRNSVVTEEEIPMYVNEMLAASSGDDGVLRPAAKPLIGKASSNFPEVTARDASGKVVTTTSAGASAPGGPLADMIAQIENSTTETAGAPPPFMSDEDVKFLFQTEGTDQAIGRYLGELSFRNQARAEGFQPPTDTLNVNLGDVSPNARTRPSRPDTSNLAGIEGASSDYGRSYKLTQALKLPFDMDRKQIANLTDKMIKGGLFTQIPGGEPTVKGDATDPQFQAAYRLLISKSIQTGEPVSNVLQTSIAAYKEMEEELEAVQNPLRTQLTDPARLRLSADALSKTVLGRRATDQERTMLVDMIHGWERDQSVEINALQVGGDNEGEDAEMTDIDWQARMEEMITQRNPGEAQSHDVADQYAAFRGMLAGPGRGTGI